MNARPTPGISLSLLGRIELVTADRDAAQPLLVRPKIVALLACLTTREVGAFMRRERLVGLLWPELDQDRAKAALRKAVHTIRSALGNEVIVSRGDDDIAVSREHIACDAADFVGAIDGGRLAMAVELYRGELMPGFHLAACGEFDHWLSNERTMLGEKAAAAAWALAQRYEQDDRLSDAGVLAKRAARFASFDERALRRAMQLLDRVGDRAGALRLFDEFARHLQTELDVEPSAETMALATQLRGSASAS